MIIQSFRWWNIVRLRVSRGWQQTVFQRSEIWAEKWAIARVMMGIGEYEKVVFLLLFVPKGLKCSKYRTAVWSSNSYSVEICSCTICCRFPISWTTSGASTWRLYAIFDWGLQNLWEGFPQLKTSNHKILSVMSLVWSFAKVNFVTYFFNYSFFSPNISQSLMHVDLVLQVLVYSSTVGRGRCWGR